MSENKKIIPKCKKIIKKSTKKKKKVLKKTSIKKVPKKIVENLEAEAPKNVNIPAWKKKIKDDTLHPKILRTKDDTWNTKINTENREIRKKGLVIFVYAMSKEGKTRFGLTASQFEGFIGKKREIPRGYPLYALDTEIAVEDESEIKFYDELNDNKILIKNCYKENPETKEIDPTKTLEQIDNWAYSLSQEIDGTIFIDSFTDYCEFTYYKLVDKVLGKKYGFNDDGSENKRVMPIQYKWRTKKTVSFLRALRKFDLNVILTAQGKEETVKDENGGAMDFHKTGAIIADALGKTFYWMDIICMLYTETDEFNNETRKLKIIKSKFAPDKLDKDSTYELEDENITVTNLIGLIGDLL